VRTAIACLRDYDKMRVLALEATNGWACVARTKREHADIARLHTAIRALEEA
jgi:hypothetical protein